MHPAVPARLAAASAALALCLAAVCAGAADAAPASYRGLCDASAAVALDDRHFVVADDEHNTLQVYRRDAADAVGGLDLSAFLGAPPDKESDLEGAARIGSRIYWIASHGRSSKGRVREERHRFFATDVVASAGVPAVRPVGRAYAGLLDDLLAAPALQPLRLAEAAALPPEAEGAPGAPGSPERTGGLNIEGLAATADGQLLIGFRNPLPRGRAIVVPLRNPAAVIGGRRAAFGTPLLLDLGGRGIRSIERVGGGFLIVAGPPADDGGFALYRWSGRAGDAAVAVPAAGFGALRPEALFQWPSRGAVQGPVQVLSDDGGVTTGGIACKDRPAAERSFRSAVLAP